MINQNLNSIINETTKSKQDKMKVDCLQEKIERNLDLKLEILLLDEK
jgi:hypothetical protein